QVAGVGARVAQGDRLARVDELRPEQVDEVRVFDTGPLEELGDGGDPLLPGLGRVLAADHAGDAGRAVPIERAGRRERGGLAGQEVPAGDEGELGPAKAKGLGGELRGGVDGRVRRLERLDDLAPTAPQEGQIAADLVEESVIREGERVDGLGAAE